MNLIDEYNTDINIKWGEPLKSRASKYPRFYDALLILDPFDYMADNMCDVINYMIDNDYSRHARYDIVRLFMRRAAVQIVEDLDERKLFWDVLWDRSFVYLDGGEEKFQKSIINYIENFGKDHVFESVSNARNVITLQEKQIETIEKWGLEPSNCQLRNLSEVSENHRQLIGVEASAMNEIIEIIQNDGNK